MSAHATPGRVKGLASTILLPGFGRAVAGTAGFNMLATITAGLGGILLARALGPTVRGQYAAITAWFGITLMIGQMGQPAALCFYVARDPLRARQYVATSRVMMLSTGCVALVAGLLLSPLLAHGVASVALGYRLAFGATVLSCVSASYVSALQARDLHLWNIARTSQPLLSAIVVGLFWRLHLLTLDSALIILLGTLAVQLAWSYKSCRLKDLAPGKPQLKLIRPLAAYGIVQIAALTPAALNSQLDQLVLSQTVAAADLGRYAIAVSLTLLPMPIVTAIGYVAFPRLAAQRVIRRADRRLQLLAVLASAALTAVMLLPLAIAAPWLVPTIFGAGYRQAVPLLWILAPGAVFLACGQVAGDILRGRNRPSVVAFAQGWAAILTVALLITLLPVFGVAGAAIASTFSYGLALVVMVRALYRQPRHARSRRAPPLNDKSDLLPELTD